MEESNEMIFKLILIGDEGCGKTNILSRYINQKFQNDTKATIGVELSSKTFTINNDKINAQFWDTAGQEKYKSMTAAYYKGALGALIVYDITKKYTFESIDRWITDLTNTADKRIKIILLGNKSDLEEQREVSREEGEMKAKEYNIAFMETSALNGNNIEIAFNKLVEEVYNYFRKEFESVANVELMRGKTITIEETKKKRKKCCDKDAIVKKFKHEK